VEAVIILLALSAATGFTLGISFSWIAIPISSAAFAVFSSGVLHLAGFGALPGISIIAACLTVYQMAYLIGVASRGSWGRKSYEHPDNAVGGRGWPKLYWPQDHSSTMTQAKVDITIFPISEAGTTTRRFSVDSRAKRVGSETRNNASRPRESRYDGIEATLRRSP
jgi:hypothetical protein